MDYWISAGHIKLKQVLNDTAPHAAVTVTLFISLNSLSLVMWGEHWDNSTDIQPCDMYSRGK